MLSLRARGYEALVRNLPAVIKALHFRAEAEALVVVVDSDRTAVHQPDHNQLGAAPGDCRLCRLQNRIAEVQGGLRLPPHRTEPLPVAVGLAVPTIEAWLLCCSDAQLTEANWQRGLRRRRLPYAVATLKMRLYGAERLAVDEQRAIAVREAMQAAADLELLEEAFPNGFGSLAATLRSWRPVP